MSVFPITEPGVYDDLDIEAYHSQGVLDGPSFSSSNLRAIEMKSPAHMYAKWSGNPNREPDGNKALNFGSAAHALILGDEVFEARHVVSPFKDFRSTEAREWRDAEAEAGRRVITQEDYRHIQNMAEVLAAHPVAQDGVLQGEVEQSVFWKDERGFWLKSRMDCRPLGDTLVDFKTAKDASERGCHSAVLNNGYDMQFALGAEGLLKAAGQRIYKHMALFQEKEPPYAVMPYPISPQAIWRAAQRNERAKREIAVCLRDDDWPGYIPSEGYFPPTWLEERLQRDEDSRLLPPPPAWLEELKESA